MKVIAILAAALIAAAVPAGAFAAEPENPDLARQRMAEQSQPRTEVAVDGAVLDRYAGDYQLTPNAVLSLYRIGDHLEARRNGQTVARLYAESDRKFFFRTVHAQISFMTDDAGTVRELVLHQGGNERHAPRIDQTIAQAELKRINSANVYRGSNGMGLGFDSSAPRGFMGLLQR